MTAQPVICVGCGWKTDRQYQPGEDFNGVRTTHEGFGLCRHCGARMVRRARPVQGFSDRKAAQARAEIAQWSR